MNGTREHYEKIRKAGEYEKIKANIRNSKGKVNLACVLNRINAGVVCLFLEEWGQTGINGINFDFRTPIEGLDHDLWLTREERDRIIDQLLELKKEYDDFILSSKPLLKLMKSENVGKVVETCRLPGVVISLDPMGERKFPCIIGPKANCSRCGCVVPYHFESMYIKKHISTLLIGKKLFYVRKK